MIIIPAAQSSPKSWLFVLPFGRIPHMHSVYCSVIDSLGDPSSYKPSIAQLTAISSADAENGDPIMNPCFSIFKCVDDTMPGCRGVVKEEEEGSGDGMKCNCKEQIGWY